MILSPNEIAFVAQPLWGTRGLSTVADGAGGFYSHFEVSVAVSLAESGGDTDIMGRSTTGANIGNRDHGLWQVSNRWHQLNGDGTPGKLLKAGATWRDPFINAKMAFEIWAAALKTGDPWIPWHVYTSGSFKTFLPDARIACKAPWAPPTGQSAVVQSIVGLAEQRIIAEVDSNGAAVNSAVQTRLAALETSLTSEIGGAAGDLEVSIKAELADTEHALEELIKRPHVLTQTFGIQQ